MDIEKLDYVKPIAENIYLIEGPNKGRFPYCNSFLFSGAETALIDTGIGETKIKEIDGLLKIDTLVLSHSHPDHIFAWHHLSDRRLLYPRETPESVYDLVDMGIRFMGSREDGVYWADTIAKRAGLKALRPPDDRFANGDVLRLGDAEVQAIHAPGHLCDHYCFFDKKSRTLLTTDIDFDGFGPWYANPECDLDTFKKDVKAMMKLPYSQVCSSHQPLIKGDAHSAFVKFLDGFDRQRRQVLEACGSNGKLDDMVATSPFYHHRFGDKTIQDIFERNMIKKNIAVLLRKNKLFRKGDRYIVKPNA